MRDSHASRPLHVACQGILTPTGLIHGDALLVLIFVGVHARMRVQEQTPSPADWSVRNDVLRRVNALVARGLAGMTDLHVEPYGSFVSNLFTPGGDLDIAVEGTTPGWYCTLFLPSSLT